MAAVPITIIGTITHSAPKDAESSSVEQVVIMGLASITGLHVGGGPAEQPPGIWGGGNQPFPTPPIHLGPGGDIGGPPGIWGGGNQPFPTPPIVIPPPPPPYPQPPDDEKPPPPEGGWGYDSDIGWYYKPGEGQASPKKGR